MSFYTDREFAPAAPRLWSDKAPPILAGPGYLDMMPDGKRLIVVLPALDAASAARQTLVTFLLNFFDELRRRVPAGK